MKANKKIVFLNIIINISLHTLTMMIVSFSIRLILIALFEHFSFKQVYFKMRLSQPKHKNQSKTNILESSLN